MPGLTQGGSTLAVSLKRTLWDNFDAEAQSLVSDVARGYCQRITSELRANDRLFRNLLSETRGISYLPPRPSLATEIARVAEAVIADIAARDALSRRINGAYMALHGPFASSRPQRGMV